MRVTTGWKAMAAVAALAVAAAGCGSDDEEPAATTAEEADASTTTTADDGGEEGAVNPEFADYCAITKELDEQEDFPSIEQLETLQAAAPDEIREEIDLVVDAFKASPDDPFAAFEVPGVEEAFGPIEDFEVENCGIEADEEEEPDQDPSVTEPDPAAAEVAVEAKDYEFVFDAPAVGRTSFTMTNVGEERHVMLLAKLVDGVTLEEVLAAENTDDLTEVELESDTAAAGEEAVLTTDLDAGEWVMVCYIPNADGEPHFNLGMAQPFTVG